MPYVESADGTKLAVEVVGDGDPVTVIGHGLTGSRGEWRFIAPLLPGTKVLYDFRGHGESDRPPKGAYSFDHFAQDVRAVAEAYGATNAAGVSLATGATLRLLAAQPDRFDKLVFLLPARLERSGAARARMLRLAEVLERHPVEEATEIVLAEEEDEGAFDEYPSGRDLRREALLGMNGDGVPSAIRELLDEPALRDPARMAAVTAPALVIGQKGDPVHTAEVAQELAEAMPNAELLLFEDRYALIREIPTLVQRVSAFLST